MLSDSKVRCPPPFSGTFSFVLVKDFQNVLRLQRVITLRHSIGFQCNLVQKQTTLSPTSCSQKIYDEFLSFVHNFGFSENGILQITQRVLGCKSGEFGFGYFIKHRNCKPCITSKHGLVVHKFNIFLS